MAGPMTTAGTDQPPVAAVPWPLPSRLDMSGATELQADFIALAGREPLWLDAGAVRHVDAAGLQLLLALLRSRHRRGLSPPQWSACSPSLQAAAIACAVADALDLPAAGG